MAQLVSLLAATIATGLMAGVFGLYSHTIMRGLANTDDRTFVGAFQSIDRAIINPLFMLTFLGALVFSGVAAALCLRDDARSLLPWVLVAFALYLAVFVITVAVHVPLNDDIKAAGDPARIADIAAVRDNFHLTRWVVWNTVRALATTVAFGCLAWALLLHGRTTSSDANTHPPATDRHCHGGAGGRSRVRRRRRRRTQECLRWFVGSGHDVPQTGRRDQCRHVGRTARPADDGPDP